MQLLMAESNYHLTTGLIVLWVILVLTSVFWITGVIYGAFKRIWTRYKYAWFGMFSFLPAVVTLAVIVAFESRYGLLTRIAVSVAILVFAPVGLLIFALIQASFYAALFDVIGVGKKND